MGKRYQKYISDSVIKFFIYKEHRTPQQNTQMTQFKNGQRNRIDISPEDTQKVIRQFRKRCLMSLVIRKKQVKASEIVPYACKNGRHQKYKW